MFSFNNYDAQENFDSGSDKLQEASKEFSHLRRKSGVKEIQVFIVVVASFITIQKFKRSESGVQDFHGHILVGENI